MSEYLNQAIRGVEKAIQILSRNQYAVAKTASLVNTGMVNPVAADSFQNVIDGYSPEQIDLVAHAMAASQPKSAGWGQAVLPESPSYEGGEEDNRYASLDAIIMGNMM